MNIDKNNFWYSWPAIVLAFIFFWPVGLFLLIKKFSVDKKAAMKAGGAGLKVFGIVLIVFAALGFFGFFMSFLDNGLALAAGDIGGLVFLLFVAVGGIALLRKSKSLKVEAENIKQYLSIIVNGNVRQLDAIAATTGKSYNVVYKDIKKMIEKGYLKNAYIDEGMREVVLPSSAPAPQFTANATATPANAAPAQTKIVVCSCCGANNTIYGDMGECEYCGSPLK